LSAVKPYSVFDQIATTLAFIGYSLPTFFTGLLFILVFSISLGWLPFIYSSLHTSYKMLRDRPEIVQRATAAFAEIVHFVEKNPDKAKAAIAKAMRTKDEEALQSSYNVYAKEIVDRTMVVPGKSVADAVELARESGTVIRRKPEDIYDNSFVFNLEKSGFLKEIWGSENYKR